MTISFHGDPATGCAAQGICAYSGTVVLRLGPSVEIAVATFRHHGRISYQAQVAGNPAAGLTVAHVQRASGGVCGDAASAQAGPVATIKSGVVAAPLFQPGGSLLSTRCAGPLDSDLAGLGPDISLPVRQLLKGRRSLDLSGSWSFASGGFAGTVISTLKLSLGRPIKQSASTRPRFPKGIRTTRNRQVTETLIVTHAQGELSESVGSDPSTCQFLDACGVQGTVNAAIAPQSPTGSLTVFGPARRPYADFLAALGLSKRGNPHGLTVIGGVDWTAGGSTVSTLNGCTSQAPLGAGTLQLHASGGRLHAEYALPGAPRTRCPGPLLGPGQALASGAVPLSQLGRRTMTVTLTGTGNPGDDGYELSQRTRLSLTLGHGPVRQQTYIVPGG